MEYLRKVSLYVDVAAKTEEEARDFLIKMVTEPFGLRLGDVTLLYLQWPDRKMLKVSGLGHNVYTPGITPMQGEQVYRVSIIWGFTTDELDLITMPPLWTLRGKHRDLWHLCGYSELRAEHPQVLQEVI